MRHFRTLAVLFIGFAAAACSTTDPVDHDDDDEHAHAEGARILEGSRVLASFDHDSQSWSSSLSLVSEGDYDIRVEFFDEDEHALSLSDEYSLKVESTDNDVVHFDAESTGGFEGHLHPHDLGTANLTFSLMHGSHADFVTAPLVVTVTEAAGHD